MLPLPQDLHIEQAERGLHHEGAGAPNPSGKKEGGAGRLMAWEMGMRVRKAPTRPWSSAEPTDIAAALEIAQEAEEEGHQQGVNGIGLSIIPGRSHPSFIFIERRERRTCAVYAQT